MCESRRSGDRCTRKGVIERVAAVAALGDDGASWEMEAFDTLENVVGHRAQDTRLHVRAPPLRNADHAFAALAARLWLDSMNATSAHCTHTDAPPSDTSPIPPVLAGWLSAFRDCFTAPVWRHVLVLVAGVVLAPGKRTVSQALRVMGLASSPGFGRYHEVLNRARWNSRAVARRLLAQVLDVFLPAGDVVIGIDDTIERRWGAKIKARGIYRDPVRSSHGHFVKASGLRWLSLMVIVPIPWASRRWALPFLTVLAPSQRWSDARHRRHKKLTDWARQAILQTKRWLPQRRIVVVADSGFASLDLIAAVHRHVCLITRLRLDASLFEPAPPPRPGRLGRPPLKGPRVPKLTQILTRIIHRTARNRPRPPNTWARDFIAKNFIKQPILIVVNDINGLDLIARFS